MCKCPDFFIFSRKCSVERITLLLTLRPSPITGHLAIHLKGSSREWIRIPALLKGRASRRPVDELEQAKRSSSALFHQPGGICRNKCYAQIECSCQQHLRQSFTYVLISQSVQPQSGSNQTRYRQAWKLGPGLSGKQTGYSDKKPHRQDESLPTTTRLF